MENVRVTSGDDAIGPGPLGPSVPGAHPGLRPRETARHQQGFHVASPQGVGGRLIGPGPWHDPGPMTSFSRGRVFPLFLPRQGLGFYQFGQDLFERILFFCTH